MAKIGHERGKTLSIAALGMAIAYLLIVVTGAIGALSVMIWLFGDTPSVDRRTVRGTFGSLRDADSFGSGSTSSSRVEPGHLEDKAA